MDDLAASVHAALATRRETICCAESLTGGELASRLSKAPGASAAFLGGVVSYATEVKRKVLGVSAERVVTAECAEQMAAGARQLMGSDWAVSTTGVAGPDRQEDQPVGTVFVGIAGPRGQSAVQLDLRGDRGGIREQTCRRALELLLSELT